MREVRFHGRGGQGAWTASLLLAQAGLREEKYIQSFPAFGPERAGAPITAFTRISDEPIHLHSSIYEPDVVVVLDPTLLGPAVVQGVKPETVIVVNTDQTPEELAERLVLNKEKVWVLDATSLALKVLGRPITNTAMLGAVVRATGLVKLDSLQEVAGERFSGRVAELNLELIKTAYEEVVEG
ncbi:MAG: 2-oxoacid:acceptor oxidoreductase family protein [Candidatus Bathyarchaeota archaeon]|nr:MAG: 2-oxoacid:acceptor oxidoreductase family protein [Candidatus Bathyarchaeota archaeon]